MDAAAKREKWERERQERREFAALPGVIHKFGKSIVIFAHPKKVARFEAEANFMSCGNADKKALLLSTMPRAVAFVPVRRGDASTDGEFRQVLYAYLLPVSLFQIDEVKGLLKRRKELKRAGVSDIEYVSGRSDLWECAPWVNRERLLHLLSGHCSCCGWQVHPNLVESAVWHG